MCMLSNAPTLPADRVDEKPFRVDVIEKEDDHNQRGGCRCPLTGSGNPLESGLHHRSKGFRHLLNIT